MATVEYEIRDRVGYVTLNRPDKLNAIDVEMRDVNDNPDVWMAVITGNGRAFSEGLKEGIRRKANSDFQRPLKLTPQQHPLSVK